MSHQKLGGLLSILLLMACGGQRMTEPEEEEGGKPGPVEYLKYEKQTQELMKTAEKLNETQGNLEEQRRRLTVICVDYPDHAVCAPQTAASYAREVFCDDDEFTRHVDLVVQACKSGSCKEMDSAEQISRSQYMVLTQRLPHSLITFKASQTRLDRRDKAQIQQFMEHIRGERGYVIVVGRASKDGSWKRNLQLAIKRAKTTREFLTSSMGMDEERVGYITYGHEKMYLTGLDAERLSERKLSIKQANRSALIFAYPCYEAPNAP